jgi:two-component system chemotaxis sensor kinase CheA
MSDYLDPNNEELLKDFFVEANSQVDIIEQNLLVLENEPENRDAIDEIFRAAHTLKGGAATVQMMELSEFTHLVEDVFDAIRNEQVSADSELIDTLLNSIDIMKSMMEASSEGTPFDTDISEIKEKLRTYLPDQGEGQAAAQEPQTEEAPSSTEQQAAASQASSTSSAPAAGGKTSGKTGEHSESEVAEMQEMAGEGESLYSVTVTFEEDNPMNTVGGIQVFAALKELGSVLKTEPDFDELYEDRFHPEVVYYITTEFDENQIREKLDMPDVIRSTDISVIEEPEEEEEAPQPAAAKGQKRAAPEKKEKEEKEKQPQQKAEEAGAEEAEEEAEEKPKQPAMKKGAAKGSVLRVDSSRIDNLLNLVSEAVINKATFNQLSTKFTDALTDFQTKESEIQEKQKEFFDNFPEYLERVQNGESMKDVKREINEAYGDMFAVFDEFENNLKNTVNGFRSTAQNLGRITTELHEKVLQIRMVPIAQIFSRFPRLVRDLSKSLNKQVNLVIEGEDTELDKSVIEVLLDPLIHCVRNSIDHGIETPEEREAAGKNPEGTVVLRATNEGNMIIIEVTDDGKGISVEDVKAKAIDRGVIHPEKELSDIEAFNLIFEPGFSTAKEVTDISGRGVGLDVVKKQIDKLNGNASIWSEPGAGTRITIKLPLTLAIIQGLLVRVGKEIYAIPITSVLDSHRIKPSEVKMIDNYEVFNVRDDVISLIRLNRLFRIQAEERRDYNFVVIVGSGERKMGLMVDSLIGEEDVVIKPLKDKYTNSPGIAGATILGDGTVSLIIDVSQLLELGLKREREQRQMREATIG